MKIIKENYLKVWKFLKENLGKTILICTVIFVICAITGVVFGMKYSEQTKNILMDFLESNKELISEEGNITALGLIKNNLTACGMSIIWGIIPFIFFTVLSLALNGFMIGIVLGFGKVTTGASIIKTLILGILPHGIFELPALIISMSMGIYLCLNLTMKIFGRGKEKISKILLEYVRLFISVILPMILIAGLIEAYITPLLLK